MLLAHARREIAMPNLKEAPPLKRFFARVIDSAIFGSIGLMAIIAAATAVPESPSGSAWPVLYLVLGAWAIGGLALLGEALFYAAAGNTPGKWLFRLRVVREGDRPLSGSEYIKRNGMIWASVYGYGIPVVPLVTMPMQHEKLRQRGFTSYDEGDGIKVFHQPTGLVRGTLIAILLLVAYTGWTTFAKLVTSDLPKGEPDVTAPAKLLSDDEVFGSPGSHSATAGPFDDLIPQKPGQRQEAATQISEADAVILDLLRKHPALDNRTPAYDPQIEARMVSLTQAAMQLGYPKPEALRQAAQQVFGPPGPAPDAQRPGPQNQSAQQRSFQPKPQGCEYKAVMTDAELRACRGG